MARPVAIPPLRDRLGQMPDLQMQKFVEARINQGMITQQDPADIPTGALQLIKNATVRYDKTTRRVGSLLLLPDKPNSNPVMKLAFIKKRDGTGHTMRITPVGIHERSTGAWTATTGILHGTAIDRIQTAVVQDELILANNGADPLQKVAFAGVASSVAALGNTKNYRYVTGFYNRVVGAAWRDNDEVRVGWSGDGNISEWDPAVDESAGFSAIVESPADLSDWITGIFSYTSVMIMLREKSVWLVSRQPIAQNPFNFYSAIPAIGCDSPFSACLIGNGLAWLDRRTGTVYAYAPGGQPEPIGRPVEQSILSNVDDPNFIFASYAPIPNEYSVCIPQVGSNYVNVWTYNLRNRAWARNEYYAITMIDDTELATAGISIDQLGDVPIDSLLGNIDSLSPSNPIVVTRAFGRNDGSIAYEDVNTSIDAPHTDFPAGIPYVTQMVSKTFTIPENDIYIAKIVIEYQSNQGGTFTLEYSKNGGATDDSWQIAKVVTPTVLGVPKLLILHKVIKCRRFAWRLTTTAGLFDTLAYEVHTYPSGQSRDGD